MIKIAVLMTSYNRCQKTLNCLEKLYAQQKTENFILKIYLVDDNSKDDTAELVRNRFPDVNLIPGNGELYWNRGMHLAWQKASMADDHDFYLWLNDDTLLFDKSVQLLLDSSKQKNNSAIIVGSTNGIDNILTYGGRCSDKKHTIIAPDERLLIKCQTFNGNIVFIPRIVFQKLGFNDFHFRHSFGDIEYGLRAQKQGINCYIAPGFYGKCERNNPIPIFRRKSNPIHKRYRLLYSPLGFNPFEDFYLNRKYYPLYKAVMWFIKLHLNVLFTVDHTKFSKKNTKSTE